MWGPQDVFRDYATFADWWWNVVKMGDGASVLWTMNTPCVPGSYGIIIN